jgi:integrase/recombinase XerD
LYTGARLSDCREFDQKSIINKILVFKPLKTKNDSIIVRTPLSDAALALTNKSGKLLTCISDAKINQALKIIAHTAKVETPLTFHVARHTFGTHYILSGGNPVELMHLMGHSKIETTMIYVHMAEEQKAALAGINQFDQYLAKASTRLRVVS